ncbi:MAG: cytochrome C, partial [Rhodoferax sp.]
MPHPLHTRMGRLALGLLAASGFALPALADGNGRMVPLTPKYKEECSACHVAYPPSLMPAASWNRIMNNLPNHFGTDASLDPATVKELSGWINAHAGTYKRVREEPPQDRITRTAW